MEVITSQQHGGYHFRTVWRLSLLNSMEVITLQQNGGYHFATAWRLSLLNSMEVITSQQHGGYHTHTTPPTRLMLEDVLLQEHARICRRPLGDILCNLVSKISSSYSTKNHRALHSNPHVKATFFVRCMTFLNFSC